MKDKFFLGLDIGTDSCGFAATDGDYNILKVSGKAIWGVRQMEAAETAEVRRQKRSGRNRLIRRKSRILLLQELFEEQIKKVDKDFFLRLSCSSYYEEDKPGLGRYSLFADKAFSDQEYYKQFKTIFHLRQELLKGGNYDIRLIYLAVHHILKYRGNFIMQGQEFSDGTDFDIGSVLIFALENINLFYIENADGDDNVPKLFYDAEVLSALTEAAKNKKLSMSARQKVFAEQMKADSPVEKMLIKAMTGGNVQLDKLFVSEEKYNDMKFSFADSKYEESVAAELQALLGDDFKLIQLLKSIYDWTIITKICGRHRYLSDAMVEEVYNKHASDLKVLKRLIAKFYPKDYSKVFRSVAEKSNYCAYISSSLHNNIKHSVKKCSKEEFEKFLIKTLSSKSAELSADPDYCYIISELELHNLLPKMSSTDNAAIPYQLNKVELIKILQNASVSHPFLKEIDPSCGLTAAQKIISILEYRIPYYIGPVNGYHSAENGGHAWIVKREQYRNERILPWTFDRIVDEAASAEKFIQRMTSKCTYLYTEDVLPKSSLLYSDFAVLNELNNLKINGDKISVELKQRIFNELFSCEKKVSGAKLKKWLLTEGYIDNVASCDISGIDKDFNSSRASFIEMNKIFEGNILQNRDIAEDIIKWQTLFTEKRIVESKIKELYSGRLSAAKIKQLKGLSFSGWGRLSAKFLVGINAADTETGEAVTIMDLLYNTNKNIQEILFSGAYNFRQVIDGENPGDESNEDYIDNLYCSPAVKRGIRQADAIVDEIVKVVGRIPDRIFVEVTRGEDAKKKGKKTPSRKAALSELYKNCKGDEIEFSKISAQLERTQESQLRSDRLYLYYTQMGRCAYSGEQIDLESLQSDMYDIDHIIPQSKLKDDSLTNRVLVTKKANMDKKDIYPLHADIRKKQFVLWKMLLNTGLIGKDKFSRLVRVASLTEVELGDFINRQLVFTSQSVDAVAKLFEKKYKDTTVVYSKARNISDFRDKFDVHKCRETNDLHHAKDAYLNVVVGNVYYTKFGRNARDYFKGNAQTFNLKKLYEYNTPGAWRADGSSIEKVKKTLARHDCLMTKKQLTRKGALYDETVYAKNIGNLIPRKESGPLSDTAKYGGFNSLAGAYFVLIEYAGKKERVRSLEAMPVLYAKRIGKDNAKVADYFAKEFGYKDVAVIIPKIRMQSLIMIGKSYANITGRSNNSIILCNANQWFTDQKTDDYVRILYKYKELLTKNILPEDKGMGDIIVSGGKSGNEHNQMITRDMNLWLYRLINTQLSKDIYKGLSIFGFAKTLKDAEGKFATELCTSEQAKILCNCITMLQCNRMLSDFSAIGQAKNAGAIAINKKIDKEAYIIEQSVTGFYTTKRALFIERK